MAQIMRFAEGTGVSVRTLRLDSCEPPRTVLRTALDRLPPIVDNLVSNLWRPMEYAPMDEFDRALSANHEALRRALPLAEKELAALTTRQHELQEKIRNARLVLGLSDNAGGDDRQLSLREAMIAVLQPHPDGLSAPAIADEIERRDLYRRGDGRPPGYGQVHNRVSHHPDQFVRFEGRIRLRRPDDA
jgi:hypothetical protein